MICEHALSPNPRSSSCVKCGRPMPMPSVPVVDPEPPSSEPPTRPRNIDMEREITRSAAYGVCDPSALIRHSEMRALRLSGEYVSDPMLVSLTRDHDREAREELADARIRVAWKLEETPDDERTPHRKRALAYIALAYNLLRESE